MEAGLKDKNDKTTNMTSVFDISSLAYRAKMLVGDIVSFFQI